MQFIADMGISGSTVKWLREHGHAAVHLRELGMQRASDAEIVEKAKKAESIILTCDLDFGDIMAASGEKHPSVVIFRLENETPANVNGRLEQVLSESSPALRQGAIIIVEDARHRVRLLPL